MVRRRTALRSLATAGVAGLGGCASTARMLGSGKRTAPPSTATATDTQSDATTPAEPTDDASATVTAAYDADGPTGHLPQASYPQDPGEFEYARMGAADAPTVTLFGNWKCPYTREFVVEEFPTLSREFVATGQVSVRFRSLAYLDGEPNLGPDAPRAAWAGLAVWAHDPATFWPYFTTVFQNQPPERGDWATLDQLTVFARTAGVDALQAVREDIHAGARDELVRDTTDAADRHDVDTVPRLVYDDEVVAPNLDPDDARRLLEDAAAGD